MIGNVKIALSIGFRVEYDQSFPGPKSNSELFRALQCALAILSTSHGVCPDKQNVLAKSIGK